MQVQIYNNRNLNKSQAAKIAPRDLQPRYLAQLQKMIDTARRNNWQRVVFALSALIDRRGRVN